MENLDAASVIKVYVASTMSHKSANKWATIKAKVSLITVLFGVCGLSSFGRVCGRGNCGIPAADWWGLSCWGPRACVNYVVLQSRGLEKPCDVMLWGFRMSGLEWKVSGGRFAW